MKRALSVYLRYEDACLLMRVWIEAILRLTFMLVEREPSSWPCLQVDMVVVVVRLVRTNTDNSNRLCFIIILYNCLYLLDLCMYISFGFMWVISIKIHYSYVKSCVGHSFVGIGQGGCSFA